MTSNGYGPLKSFIHVANGASPVMLMAASFCTKLKQNPKSFNSLASLDAFARARNPYTGSGPN